MNNLLMGLIVMIGTAGVMATDLPKDMSALFKDTLAAAQQVSTAGDLKSISTMLDASYVMDRRLPAEEDFEKWLGMTFKENHIKDLRVDHWGNPLSYTVLKKNRRYQLRSLGPDGIENTDDDMVKTGP
nr:type II secretion system protein GspG [uncultured Desulfobacter sp.]